MLTPVRIAALALAGFYLTVTLLTALVGSFADGGDALSRLLLTVVHPVCAVALVAFVAVPRPSRGFALAVACLMAVNIVADAAVAIAIATGATKGDWWLPMIFSVVPALGIAYAAATTRPRPAE